jgi:hypothetical protein
LVSRVQESLFHPLAIMGLLPAHISKISEGSIVFKGIMLQTERKGIAKPEMKSP